MYVNGEEINLYNFKYNNVEDYYDIKGKSITKSLMKTPINGARLSSSFGMRKHPILGYNKMHRGTDFAALWNSNYGLRIWNSYSSKMVWWRKLR